MSDETEKAGYPEETTATEEQSPLERTMMSLHASAALDAPRVPVEPKERE